MVFPRISYFMALMLSSGSQIRTAVHAVVNVSTNAEKKLNNS